MIFASGIACVWTSNCFSISLWFGQTLNFALNCFCMLIFNLASAYFSAFFFKIFFHSGIPGMLARATTKKTFTNGWTHFGQLFRAFTNHFCAGVRRLFGLAGKKTHEHCAKNWLEMITLKYLCKVSSSSSACGSPFLCRLFSSHYFHLSSCLVTDNNLHVFKSPLTAYVNDLMWILFISLRPHTTTVIKCLFILFASRVFMLCSTLKTRPDLWHIFHVAWCFRFRRTRGKCKRQVFQNTIIFAHQA